MPNIPSAMKRMRSDAKKRARRQAVLSELKSIDKKLRLLTQDPSKAAEAAQNAVRAYDKAASKGIIPKQRAARKKSRVAKWLAGLKKS
ncbi:MAG: 30S ribosomal protein S20 [Candidatus Omnitrophota bacterium]